jgi:hypothetical protein
MVGGWWWFWSEEPWHGCWGNRVAEEGYGIDIRSRTCLFYLQDRVMAVKALRARLGHSAQVT